MSKASWKFACATASGIFLFATGIHVVESPGEWVDFVANGVDAILPEQQDEATAVSSVE